MNTKRKILIGGSALAAVSLVGAGTLAYFSDSEVSANQSLRAGTLDLAVHQRPNTLGPSVNLANVKPGDSGTFEWALDNFGTLPGDLSLQVVVTGDDENSCNEPEDAADLPLAAGCGADGELDDALLVQIHDDHGITDPDPDIDGWSGTLRQLHNETAAARHPYFRLDAPPGGSTRQILVKWALPSTEGNAIQSDSVTFHLNFQLDQQTP